MKQMRIVLGIPITNRVQHAGGAVLKLFTDYGCTSKTAWAARGGRSRPVRQRLILLELDGGPRKGRGNYPPASPRSRACR
jgi:hypothetical protein